MPDLFLRSSADISQCGRYRWRLSRTWDEALPTACWIMLNPSIADAEVDDPTIKRCMGFAQDWSCGGISVVNLFALRSPNPNALHDADDPVGPDNDWHIAEVVRRCNPVVAAWGVMGTYRDRELVVLSLIRVLGIPLQCLGRTKHGRPRHPLYVPSNTCLIPFENGG